MGSQIHTMLCVLVGFSMATELATGIVPQTSQYDVDDQSTFHRHFWSTSDKHHYKLSEDGEVAELVLDQTSGNYCGVLKEKALLRLSEYSGRFLKDSLLQIYHHCVSSV